MSETTYKSYEQSRPIHRSKESTAVFRRIVLPLVMFSIVMTLWVVSLPKINPANMNDLGLVSVLPITYFLALGFLAISFMFSVYQKDVPEIILFMQVLLLIFIIHGTPQLVYGTLRYSWAWKHVGIVDFIQQNGNVNPTISNLNAYQNWPGFFVMMALYNSVAGLSTSVGYAGWGPVFFNILNLGALLLLFKTLTKDNRLVWMSVWLYFLFSWIGQDYFSPQAYTFFLFLVVVTIVLRWFRRQPVPVRTIINPTSRLKKIIKIYHAFINHSLPSDLPIVQSTGSQRVFLMLFMILVFFVIASSHQLTPLMLVSGLVLLAIFQVTDQKYIPILLLTITAAWITYMAVGFLNGNLYWIIQSIGSLLGNLNTTVNLAIASPYQQIIANVDRLLSVSVWVLAFIGLYRRYRSGKWDLSAVLLALSPIPMVAVNSYGGEMIFRVYMFSLPFQVFLAASTFYPKLQAGTSRKTFFYSLVASLLILPPFLLSYFGKDRIYYFTPNEVAAAQAVYNTAPKGSLIMDGIWDWPKQYVHYDSYNYISLLLLSPAERQNILQNPAKMLSEYMDVAQSWAVNVNPPSDSALPDTETLPPGYKVNYSDYPAAYFVITRSQIAEAEMTGTLPNNWSNIIISSLSQSPNFKVIYSNTDAVVIQYLDPTGR